MEDINNNFPQATKRGWDDEGTTSSGGSPSLGMSKNRSAWDENIYRSASAARPPFVASKPAPSQVEVKLEPGTSGMPPKKRSMWDENMDWSVARPPFVDSKRAHSQVYIKLEPGTSGMPIKKRSTWDDDMDQATSKPSFLVDTKPASSQVAVKLEPGTSGMPPKKLSMWDEGMGQSTSKPGLFVDYSKPAPKQVDIKLEPGSSGMPPKKLSMWDEGMGQSTSKPGLFVDYSKPAPKQVDIKLEPGTSGMPPKKLSMWDEGMGQSAPEAGLFVNSKPAPNQVDVTCEPGTNTSDGPPAGFFGAYSKNPRTSSGTVCFNCGKEGHKVRDCPQPPTPPPDCTDSPIIPFSTSGGKGSKKSGHECRKCDNEGHFARNCTESTGGSAGRPRTCCRCTGGNHSAKEHYHVFFHHLPDGMTSGQLTERCGSDVKNVSVFTAKSGTTMGKAFFKTMSAAQDCVLNMKGEQDFGLKLCPDCMDIIKNLE